MGKSIKDLLLKIKGMFSNKKKLPEGKEETKMFSEKEATIMAEEVIKDNKSTFKEEIKKMAEVSKLDPSRYSTTQDMYMALLEDMGLNEQFKENPRAKEDLSNFVEEIVKEDKSSMNLINVRGNLCITNENDMKKIQQILSRKGVKVQENAVKYYEIKEPQTDPYIPSSNNHESEYHEFAMNNGIYERGTIFGSAMVGTDRIDTLTIRKSYTQDGVEVEQEKLMDSIKYDNLKNKGIYEHDGYDYWLKKETNINNKLIIGDNIHRKNYNSRIQISRSDEYPDVLDVNYVNGTNGETRKIEVLNREDKDLADLFLDPSVETALKANNEDKLTSLKNETLKRHTERGIIINSIPVFKKEIMEKINDSKFKTGLMKMAEKAKIIDKENEEQQLD